MHKMRLALITMCLSIILPNISIGSDYLKDFGTFKLKMQFENNKDNLHIYDRTNFNIDGASYTAINCYETYPNDNSMGFLSIALIKNELNEYTKVLEKMLFDTGHPREYLKPFLFKSEGLKFIVFGRRAGKGHFDYYSIFLVSDNILEVSIEDYHSNKNIISLLKDNENIYMMGPSYLFEGGQIACKLTIYKNDDPRSSPTGGTLFFSYKFVDNSFKINAVERSNIVEIQTK